ncbi:Phosphate-starvation-inducible E [uncultured archaeon]|nr:Phosphate-starvation-inducible E [uncultured archaeon]
MEFKFSTYFEGLQKIILIILTMTMALVTLIAALDLIYTLAIYLIFPPVGLQIKEILSFFGSILLVLIAVELLETFRAFQIDKTINVLMVFLVALIAMARKLLIMEINGYSDSTQLFGLSAVVIALSIGYYLIKKSSSCKE